MKIGVYGGSFNPPHLGHKKLAEYLGKILGLNKIYIIPSNISPQKSDNGNIDPIHRLNMCRLAFAENIFEVSDTEISRGGRSYTVDTLTEIKAKHIDDEIYLFMGSDMLLSLKTWRSTERILELAAVCAISRENSDSADGMKEYALKNFPNADIRIFDVEPFKVSSTEIRENLKNGGNSAEFLAPAVREYIEENKLYGSKRV